MHRKDLLQSSFHGDSYCRVRREDRVQHKQLPDSQLHPLVTATRVPNHDSNLPLRLPLVVLNLFFGKRHRVNRRFWIFPVPLQFPPFGSFLIGFVPSSLVDWVPAPLVSCEENGWSGAAIPPLRTSQILSLILTASSTSTSATRAAPRAAPSTPALT